MRAAIYAVMTSLWLSASPALARNGETGILVMVQTFEFLENDQQEITSLVLCSEDMARVSQWLDEGYVTSIFLPGYGVYPVAATPEGAISLEQKNIEILSRECQISVKPNC